MIENTGRRGKDNEWSLLWRFIHTDWDFFSFKTDFLHLRESEITCSRKLKRESGGEAARVKDLSRYVTHSLLLQKIQVLSSLLTTSGAVPWVSWWFPCRCQRRITSTVKVYKAVITRQTSSTTPICQCFLTNTVFHDPLRDLIWYFRIIFNDAGKQINDGVCNNNHSAILYILFTIISFLVMY